MARSIQSEARDMASWLEKDAEEWEYTADGDAKFRNDYNWMATVEMQRKAAKLIRQLARAARKAS
jgi:hypothetical protein